jgi:hypothetical protein
MYNRFVVERLPFKGGVPAPATGFHAAAYDTSDGIVISSRGTNGLPQSLISVTVHSTLTSPSAVSLHACGGWVLFAGCGACHKDTSPTCVGDDGWCGVSTSNFSGFRFR